MIGILIFSLEDLKKYNAFSSEIKYIMNIAKILQVFTNYYQFLLILSRRCEEVRVAFLHA